MRVWGFGDPLFVTRKCSKIECYVACFLFLFLCGACVAFFFLFCSRWKKLMSVFNVAISSFFLYCYRYCPLLCDWFCP